MSSHCLDAQLRLTRPGFGLDIALAVEPGEVVALLGPNGSGKSTTLRLLAGLTPMEAGRILLDGTDITQAPTESRPVGMVFQDYLLFAHMSAAENVAFGPRCRGVPRHQARREAAQLLEHVGLGVHAHKRPGMLSGGQAQRVALARALAVQPRLLLLDEPLSALDAHTRLSVRSQLRRHLNEFDGGTIVVTHDPMEAMVLADRIIIVEDGSVVQQGTSAEVAHHPRTDYIARLVGLNLYRGHARETVVDIEPGTPGAQLVTRESNNGEVFAAFPPKAVAIFRERPPGSPRNAWQMTVDSIETFGDQVRVHLVGELSVVAEITPAALAELQLSTGEAVWACVKATEVSAYPA